MPKASKAKRLKSRKLRVGQKRTLVHTRKGARKSDGYLALKIVAGVVVVLSLAVLITAFAVSMFDAAHTSEVWFASERIITIVITGLFAIMGSSFFRQ